MAEDLNKKIEELQENDLDAVAGGGDTIKQIINTIRNKIKEYLDK